MDSSLSVFMSDALRVGHVGLYWFAASAYYWLAVTNENIDEFLLEFIDSSLQFNSTTEAFIQLKRALKCTGCSPEISRSRGSVDILIDGIGGISLSRRDKVLVVLFLLFEEQCRWYTQGPTPGAPHQFLRAHESYMRCLARHNNGTNMEGSKNGQQPKVYGGSVRGQRM